MPPMNWLSAHALQTGMQAVRTHNQTMFAHAVLGSLGGPFVTVQRHHKTSCSSCAVCCCCSPGFVPGAVRIPRQMLVLRSDALSRVHTKLVAYDSTDARSLQVAHKVKLCLMPSGTPYTKSRGCLK